jgi:hypothetical protein
MKNLIARRERLLQEMAQCDRMEYGSLHAERRAVAGGGLSRPYFKHQVWDQGRNLSQRVRAEEAAELQSAIANRQRFEQLAREYMDVTVELTRRRQDSELGAKKNARRWKRPSLRKSSSS